MRGEKTSFETFAASSGAFRQEVRLAALQVAGLRDEELAQALAYEVEPFSGIPAVEAEVRYRPLDESDPNLRAYEVVVRRRKQGTGTNGVLERFLWPMRIVAALVVVAVATDAILLHQRHQRLVREVAERRPLQQVLDRLNAEARSIRTETAGLRQKREDAVRAQDEAVRLRQAPCDLLHSISEKCGSRAVVTSIVAGEQPRSVMVSAVGLSAEAAAALMQDLGVCLEKKGWTLRPGMLTASETGASVRFAFTLAFER